MKILLFVLGDIYRRLLEGREKSYADFLKSNDVIFFGPIPSSSFVLNEKRFKVIQVNQVMNFLDFFEKIPNDWHPDIAVIETPVLNLIPDFFKIGCKTLCRPRDSWADMIYNRNIFDFFDFNHYQTVDRFKYLIFRANLVTLTGAPVCHIEYDKSLCLFEKRKIDVLSIANINEGFYHQRAKIFNKIASKLNNKFNILFTKGIPKSEISSYYENSKIVIDFSYVTSSRAYEAIGNGCLFFSFEDNPLISEVFAPENEYIPFSLENLNKKIGYYLANSQKAQEIINNGRNKLKHLAKHPAESLFKQISYTLSQDVDISSRIINICNWSKSKYYHSIATPLYFNYNYPNKNIPENWKELYFERIEQAIQHADDNVEIIPPIIEASRMAFLLRKYEIANVYLDKLIKILPKYAWTYWLKGRIHYDNNELEISEEYLRKSIDIAIANPELLKKYILPFAEKGNTADQRRIGEYLYDKVAKNNDEEYQLKTILHLCNEMLGDIYSNTNIEDAKVYYIKSIDILAVPTVVKKLAFIYLQKNEYDNLIATANKGLKDSPYDNKLILLKAIGFLCNKSIASKDYYDFLKQQINVFSCYSGDRRIKLLQVLFKVLYILRLTKWLHKKLLLKVYNKI